MDWEDPSLAGKTRKNTRGTPPIQWVLCRTVPYPLQRWHASPNFHNTPCAVALPPPAPCRSPRAPGPAPRFPNAAQENHFNPGIRLMNAVEWHLVGRKVMPRMMKEPGPLQLL